MPIYTFKCPNCGYTTEMLRKAVEDSNVYHHCKIGDNTYTASKLEQVLSVPSPMQWGCRKGF